MNRNEETAPKDPSSDSEVTQVTPPEEAPAQAAAPADDAGGGGGEPVAAPATPEES